MTETLLAPPKDDPLVVDPNKNFLEELVGEGKKFKTPQDLARGKYEADLYVKTLERQQDELRSEYTRLREDYTARAKLEELIDQLSTHQKPPTSSEQPPANEVKTPSIDPKEIESLVSSKILEHEVSRKQQANFDLVRDKLKERFGNSYQNAIKEQIDLLGLSEEDINALARKSPTAFFKTLGFDQQQQEPFQAPPRSAQRSDNFSPTTKKRTWAYYQDMKRTNPKQYFDSKTTIQMHKDAIDLGDAFKDGDYNAV